MYIHSSDNNKTILSVLREERNRKYYVEFKYIESAWLRSLVSKPEIHDSVPTKKLIPAMKDSLLKTEPNWVTTNTASCPVGLANTPLTFQAASTEH
jgi:UDP-N-acetylglucosamine:LPS N-acetylglucosamine transferase